MKVLVAPARYYLEDKGGSANSKSFEFVIALAKQGVEVHAVVGRKNLTVKKLPKTLFIHELQPGSPSKNTLIEMWRRLWFSLQVAYFALRFCRSHKVSVVHHFSRVPVEGPAFPSLLAFFPKRWRPPLIIGPIQEGAGDLAADQAGFHGWLERSVKKDIFFQLGRRLFGLSARAFEVAKRNSLARAELVVCMTKAVYNKACEYLAVNRLAVQPSGVDTELFRPTRNKLDTNIILAASELIERKGLRYLIEAFVKVVKEYPHLKLQIVGKGLIKKQLEDLVKERGIQESVDFSGFTPYRKMVDVYNRCMFFVNPTLREPFSNTNLEVMACGCPLITTCGLGITCNATEDVALLVKPRDVDGLAKAMVRLVRDRELRRRLARKARRHALKYSWREVSRVFVGYYEELINN